MSPKPNTAREFLESYREACLERRRCKWRIKQLEDQATSITTSVRDMPGGGSSDPHKDHLLIAIADQQRKLNDLKLAAAARQLEVEQFTEQLEDPAHRIILQLRYCDLLLWPEVNEALKKFGIYYSERHTHRLHDNAIEAAELLWRKTHER
jgi:hypothetical protein